MKVEALKEKARRHEQKEEWQKALDLYREALQKQDPDESPDITLYNRVGDIQTRVGQTDGAVASYEKAIELYLEAELPNNAIAICKKVLRNLPDRSIFFLRMGQIRGAQGFLTDARQSFLTYAEMMTAAGEMDTALDALVEFVALAPEDLEIRLGLASQLEARDRTSEAVEQYMEGYRRLILHDREREAQALGDKVRELSPDTMVPDPQSIRAGRSAAAAEGPVRSLRGLAGMELGSGIQEEAGHGVEEVAVETEFGEIEIGGSQTEDKEEAPVAEPALAAAEESGGFEIAGGLGEEEGTEEEEGDFGEPLPTFGFGEAMEGEAVDEDEEVAEPLPTMDFGEEEDEEDEGESEPLPTMDFGEEEDDREAEPLPTLDFSADKDGGEAEPALFPEDFGVADYGDRESKEYVESEEALPELEVSLDELSLELQAESPMTESPITEALEEAVEDAAFEAAVDQEAPAPVVEAPAPVVEAAPPARRPSTHTEAAEMGDLEMAMELLRAQIASRPDEVELYQRLVEYAFRRSDPAVLIPAYMELAGCLNRAHASAKARAIYQQVLSLSPGHVGATDGLAALEGTGTGKRPVQVASSEEYVDLGSMILGDAGEKTTRWKVTADAPSGDDQADFAKMLSQFKQKVSEHVDADDVSAHHDLGTAYMEMGLLDEAVSEFQMALRASPDHLPTHEVMGRCWMEKGNPDMAARALKRALEIEAEVEDELIGIYYLMGRAQQDLGNTGEAVEFYEKVFSLDINFEDVTERLRALREDQGSLPPGP